jgi:hypothetical protein
MFSKNTINTVKTVLCHEKQQSTVGGCEAMNLEFDLQAINRFTFLVKINVVSPFQQ